MLNIKIKNSIYNNVISFLKANSIRYETRKNEDGTEKVHFFPKTNQQKNQLVTLLNNYGSNIYHDTILRTDLKVKTKFNYISNQYENMTIDNIEEELPMFYLENVNEQNERLEELKSITSRTISESYIKSIANSQSSLRFKTNAELLRIKNVYFGKDFNKNRSKNFVDEFPYYNKIQFNGYDNNNFLGDALNKIDFLEETLEDFIFPKGILTTEFFVNDVETELETYSLQQTLSESMSVINEENKVVLNKSAKKGRFAGNNFKKHLMLGHLNNNGRKFIKSFKQIFENEHCEKEFFLFKIEKFRRLETFPLQSFWMNSSELNDFYDYQIKMNTSYRYKIKAYCIIYGTETAVENVMEHRNGVVTVDFIHNPSYRIAIVDLEEATVKVVPNPQPPPVVKFLNESNSKNSIKIYLDLKNSNMSDDFITITSDDSRMIENVEKNPDGKINFEYLLEDGKFEVFRLSNKPESYSDFENGKILDVRNSYSSTSVVFKDMVLPNKKYYYMFRALNLAGIPSNPTKVYEVEMIKDASKSRIEFTTIDLMKKQYRKDKNFKSLLQITPASEQDIFDDETTFVNNLPTFDKKINDLTLGIAQDKVWGKKFKIRIKSKDTGKIIDLNVKFNLIKDNIK